MFDDETIRILGETIHRRDIRRIVVDEPNEALSLLISLQDDSVMRVDGKEARAALVAICELGFVEEADAGSS